ncbi:hypothetical protein MRB53_038416 [Persea americana]|nr:hypothetical protein MRB53_038416 [Persea americana]
MTLLEALPSGCVAELQACEFAGPAAHALRLSAPACPSRAQHARLVRMAFRPIQESDVCTIKTSRCLNASRLCDVPGARASQDP